MSSLIQSLPHRLRAAHQARWNLLSLANHNRRELCNWFGVNSRRNPIPWSKPPPDPQYFRIERVERMQFVSIPAGSFMMGCSAGDNECYAEEKPSHRVSITRPFEIGKYQVTQAEYETVMATNPSYSRGPNHPVDGVSWEDAQKFCEAVNRKGDGHHYRLPTEAEWEYAARGGDSSCRYGSLDVVAWFRDNSGGTTHPVGEKKPNRFGLYDTRWGTSGNGCRTGTA